MFQSPTMHLTIILAALLLAAAARAQEEDSSDSLMQLEESGTQGLTGFRLWWSRLWPAAKPIGNVESDDKKMHYGYTETNGPGTWSLEYPLCGGGHQSPVDLSAGRMQRAAGTPLHWTSSFWQPPANMTLRNSGHTVEVSGKWDPMPSPELRGGPLHGGYTFWQMHFHWGTKDTRGSEHTVNNRSYPMEMHAVHYKTDYGSPSNALKYPDGLAVVGFLFQMSSKPGASLRALIPALPTVRSSGSSVAVSPVPLSTLLAPPRSYATYQGSLTTPPCSEGVTWLVSGASLPVSTDQLETFRSLSSHDGDMGDNYRPVQPLNGRSLFYVS
ncbi:hypothetical protein B566_EDAN011239 [Ephemera danica]|nr:hypothetical protein B566_EDAN011239 [Ephemera danica]